MKKSDLKNLIFILILLGAALFGEPVLAQDQGALKLSITPPLYKINMDPGETWSSTVKLVNNNIYPVTVYAEVLDFKSGATGGVEFIKDSAGGVNKGALSGWVEIKREPLTIAPQQSAELPFSVELPATAGPGGHYAAILAGSKPPEGKAEGSEIKISSMLASLLLVRVSGAVVEQGEIREFSVDKNWSGDLSTKFKVVFLNTGNVHLQPAGEIKIINMWGETRAVIKIDKKSSFGNVLPNSAKEWEFDWQGESAIMDAGRLRAEVALGYGEEATQTDARALYFWTFALKPTAIVLGIIILFLLIIILLIRRYINQSLRQVREQAARLAQPEKILAGASSQKSSTRAPEPAEEQLSWSLFKRVTVFLLIIVIAVLIALAFYNFGGFKQSAGKPATPTTSDNESDTVKEPLMPASQTASSTAASTGAVTITDTAPVDLAATSSTSSSAAIEPVAATTTEQKVIKASILNGGGVRGAAARAAELIKSSSLEITSLGNADNFDYLTTEIRFKSVSKIQAESIKLLLGSFATLIEDEKITEDVVVILGKDFK